MLEQRFLETKNMPRGLGFLIAIFIIYTSNAGACAINPMYQISENPKTFVDRYNSLFLGKIVSVEEQTKNMQIVEFEVIEFLKGNLLEKVSVSNPIASNCSMFFGGVGSKYYVFGNANSEGNKIHFDGFPSFVSIEHAVELGMLEGLTDY